MSDPALIDREEMVRILRERLADWRETLDANGYGNLAMSANDVKWVKGSIAATEYALSYISELESRVARYEERIKLSSSAMNAAAEFVRSAYRDVAGVLDEVAKNNAIVLEEKG